MSGCADDRGRIQPWLGLWVGRGSAKAGDWPEMGGQPEMSWETSSHSEAGEAGKCREVGHGKAEVRRRAACKRNLEF